MLRFQYNRDQVCFVLNMHTMPAHRNWENFSISFWSIPWAENSLYHKHTYFEYNHLVTKQLAVAYKTQKSWEWEVLFLLLVSAENYTRAGWNTVYYHSGWSSTSPAVCNFTSWWVQRESPLHTCLAVLSCWPGGCWLSPWMGQGPTALSCTSLWWECQQRQLRVGEASAEQGTEGTELPFPCWEDAQWKHHFGDQQGKV